MGIKCDHFVQDYNGFCWVTCVPRFVQKQFANMDDQQRLMHQQGPVSMPNASNMMPQPYPNMAPTEEPSDQRKQEIGDILQQIMTITDQSLDEAQARYSAESVQYFHYPISFSSCCIFCAIRSDIANFCVCMFACQF